MADFQRFGSGKEKYLFFGVITVFIIIIGLAFYPSFHGSLNAMNVKDFSGSSYLDSESLKTPKYYYDMFQCSCCGKSIDADCCGSAKQRKAYVDQLISKNLEEDEIIYQMVKKFGFDVLKDPSKEQEVKDYIKKNAPDNPPVITIENSRYDFGVISQSDGIVSTSFTIENTGGDDLVIDNLDSSCMCTTATLVYDGVESPEFGMSMHGNNPEDYSLAIPPGDSAELRVFYDPNAHGKQKKSEAKITREITVISNDPVDFQKKVRIELIQTP